MHDRNGLRISSRNILDAKERKRWVSLREKYLKPPRAYKGSFDAFRTESLGISRRVFHFRNGNC